ncbi:phage tail protein [Pseudomonas sp. Irchel s3f7]|uniref:phage tail-collar fiber domain-containing protein n=1 Tax=Pseudomonas sp. Irchel s3f7 TaxID=2009153 RepID=UPI000BA40982|nr:phage tail protein [Pseudomonas sp. Irchel s3f7]
MIDKTSQFFAILTAVGEAKHANAIAMGLDWMFTEMGLGDANGTDPIPDRLQTELINEWRRAPLNQIRVDPANPNTVITEQIIPPEVGGEWIREIGLYDVDGDLVAVANCAPSYKPLLAQGTGKTQVVRMNFIVSSSANIVLKIDPAVVLATREYVDLAISEALAKLDHKQSARVAATAPITLSNVQTIDDVAVVIGDRVLVTAQEEAEDNGLYVVSVEGWTRAADADNSLEVTPGLFIHVEQGTVNGDSLWQLVTDAPITLGTTGLQFELIAGGSGAGVGTFRSVTVDALGRVVAGTNPTTLDGYGITDALPVDGTAVAATQLETARTLSISGAGSGSVLFDGTADADIELALADSGVTAGTYSSVTVNAQGVVTAGDQLTTEDLGLGTAAMADTQTHLDDATPEALMKVGAFGLGGTGIDLPPDTNLDTVILGGFYRVNTGGNIPSGAEFGSMSVIRSTDTIAQILVSYQSGTIFSRGASGVGGTPVFSPWATGWNDTNFNPANYALLSAPHFINGIFVSGTVNSDYVVTVGDIVSQGGLYSHGNVYAGHLAADGGGFLAGDGNVYGPVWGGYLNVHLANNYVSYNNLMPTIAAQPVGGLGTYGLFAVSGGGPTNPGAVVAGGNLIFTDAAASSNHGTAAGTWILMGGLGDSDGQYSNSVCICLRVA